MSSLGVFVDINSSLLYRQFCSAADKNSSKLDLHKSLLHDENIILNKFVADHAALESKFIDLVNNNASLNKEKDNIEKSIQDYNDKKNTIDNKRIVNNIDNKNKTTDIIEKKKKFDYTPDENDSRVQQSKAKSGTGFCYIGEDRGFRSCIDVKEGDVCMSGDIFPSRDICINPRLRE